MSGLYLSIAEAALHEAVVEQIKAAKLPAPQKLDPTALPVGQSDAVVVVDHDGDDKGLADILARLAAAEDRPVLLMLGGADDAEGVTETFSKPFRLGHFITRLRYYLETAPLLRHEAISFGPYRLEPLSRQLSREGAEAIRLTEKETALLVFLAHRDEPATRAEILAAVWGYDERIDTHTLETHIYQLRRKMDGGTEGGESWLVNEAGAYRLARGVAA